MSNIGPINIIPDNNQVVLQDNNKTITVVDSNSSTNVDVTQPITSVVQISTGPMGSIGSQGPSGSQGSSGSQGPSGSQGTSFPYTGSADITGSLFLIGQGSFTSLPAYITSDFFLVRNSTTTLKVIDGVQISSSAQTPLQVLNNNNLNLLQISQSGVVVFATSSVILTGTAPNGAIYFTSSSFYVGIE